ncbi:MAG TPA: hypothetical protein K8V94_00365 [Corynebacterium amycolatum]|nr:hypothetical protein [Corynebacterium amycolatum]
MGRLILLLFIILVVVMLWKAFGPGSRGNGMRRISAPQPEPRPLAPDDDPEFLWKLKKAEFDRRKREQERREREQDDNPDNPGETD